MSSGHPFRAERNEMETQTMCKVIEEMRNQTVWETKVEAARGLHSEGVPKETIAKALNLSIEQVNEILGEKSA